MRRTRDALLRLGATMLTVGLLGGVPVGLAVGLGWPLPRRLPSTEAVQRALTEGFTVDVVKVLAVILWVAWLPLALLIVLDLIGTWRRWPQLPRLPLVGPLQPLIARLVATAVLGTGPALSGVLARPALAVVAGVELDTSSTGATRTNGPPVPRPPRQPTTPVIPPVTAPAPEHAPETPPTTPTAPPNVGEPKRYLVHRGDTLIGLARRHLGDGERFMEIFELSRGVVMPTGRPFVDPDDVVTGTVLLFPSDAVGVPGLPEKLVTDGPDCDPPSRSSGPMTPKVGPERGPEKPAPAVPGPPASLNGGSVGSTTTLPLTSSPNGDHTTASTNGRSSPSTRKVDLEAGGSRPQGNRPPDAGTRADSDRALAPLSVAFLAGGLLGAGVVRMLDRLRTVQRRHRRPGRRIRLPEPELARSEAALREGATHVDASLVRGACALLAARLHGVENMPVIVGLEVKEDKVEFLLDSPVAQPPDGFIAVAGGRRWRVEKNEAYLDESTVDTAPLPLLMTVGVTDDDASLLIDLEQAGVTSVEGDEHRVRKALLAAALELATGEMATACRIVVVGLDDRLDFIERVHRVDSLEALVEDLERQGTDIGRLVAECDCASAFEARVRDPAGDWTPTVVICATATPVDAVSRLVAAAIGPSQAGISVLIAGPVAGAQVRIEVVEHSAVVRPYGISVGCEPLSEKDIDALFALWEVARDCEDVAPTESAPPVEADMGDAQVRSPEEASNAENDHLSHQDGPMGAREDDRRPEVRFLGPVDVAGGAEPLERSKSLEAVTYLVLHREGIGGDRLMEKLWPGRSPSSSTFNTTVSVARGCLGSAPDGSLYLPHVGAGPYRLSPDVGSDLGRFRSLVRRANAVDDGHEAMPYLRAALELVRGRPFETDGRGYQWAHEEGFISEIAAEVADVAHDLAQRCLVTGDGAGARWAARQGLRASEGDEQLYRDLMQAEDLDGNRAGISSIMEELAAVAEDLEPFDGLHPETVALYRRLTARPNRGTGSLARDKGTVDRSVSIDE